MNILAGSWVNRDTLIIDQEGMCSEEVDLRIYDSKIITRDQERSGWEE